MARNKHLVNISCSLFTWELILQTLAEEAAVVLERRGWKRQPWHTQMLNHVASLELKAGFMLTFAGLSPLCWFPYEFQMRPWAHLTLGHPGLPRKGSRTGINCQLEKPGSG